MRSATAPSVVADWVDHRSEAMGGRLTSYVTFDARLSEAGRVRIAMLLRDLSARVSAWAALATRHHPSQLTALNADERNPAPIGPTLASLLSWAADAYELTGGLVDVGLLVQRIAAEESDERAPAPDSDRAWVVDLRLREIDGRRLIGGGSISRPRDMKLDLDGVGKGWIADRAADLLVHRLDAEVAAGGVPAWSSCFVDGDGDIALRHRRGAQTAVTIEVPRSIDAEIGELLVRGDECGVATSGTGIHQWGGRHHLIDPRTGSPSASGIAQATVVAESARVAEAWAKAIVIGGAAAIRRAEAAGVAKIVAVDDAGAIVTAPFMHNETISFAPAERSRG